ncbi:hypothetical protein GCM10009557_32910 [Virgisporangium ochraceum]|uniref:GGDEF domain-containing protein n=1 Tax=Virgisporangium ochraceum TaxID=65505 RepID=A0A8J3ZYA4_9ACTN|nr:hypothetical protein Voc01_063650 [Virgisporangium ochraceum]
MLCVAYFALPWDLAATAINVVLNAAAGVALVVGPARARTMVRWPWFAMATSMWFYAAGLSYYGAQVVLVGRDVFPSPADYLLLAGALSLIVALTGFVRVRRAHADRPGVIDALIVSTGAGMLSWVFLMSPHVHAGGLSGLARVVLLAYPVTALFSLALVLRMALGRRNRPVPYLMLVVAVAAGLFSDTAYSLLMLSGTYRFGDPIDLGWLAMRVLLGAAALHPGITGIFVPTATRSSGVIGNGRFAALALASLCAPAALTIQWLRHERLDVPVFACGAVVLFLLVIARLWGVMSGLSRALATVERLANTDQLTGLANRRQFHDRWHRVLAGSTGPTALLYVDLDGFKPVNDTLGHAAGDAVLVAAADRMRTNVRADTFIARIGGDEFAVVLPDVAGDDAHSVARRIVEVLAEPFTVHDGEAVIGASVGVVVADAGDDPDVVLRRADAAMYAAKARGRGRVGVVDGVAPAVDAAVDAVVG